MSEPAQSPPSSASQPQPSPCEILVAGDVCLDVVAVPTPGRSRIDGSEENWRLTGETRTHFLPGGAMLLARFIRSALQSSGVASPNEDLVRGPRPVKPEGIANGPDSPPGPLKEKEFLGIAERLRRDEIVHSLLGLQLFLAKPGEKSQRLRVEKAHGFSGPDKSTNKLPSIVVDNGNDQPGLRPQFVVLDDTGNSFRKEQKGTMSNPWPSALGQPAKNPDSPLLIYKLHRPLPAADQTNFLWEHVHNNFKERSIVITSVEDLREAGASISRGLSWERTSLDIVWHLLNFDSLAQLRDCKRLIITIGTDGALLWQRTQRLAPDNATPKYEAWLVYDPAGIEGSHGQSILGEMVGLSSAFTAAFLGTLYQVPSLGQCLEQAIQTVPDRNEAKVPYTPTELFGLLEARDGLLIGAIKRGLHAARTLHELGFGTGGKGDKPDYPGVEIFLPQDKSPRSFVHQPVPVLANATEADRGYWRLLDSVFAGERAMRDRAVEIVAMGLAKKLDKPDEYGLTPPQMDAIPRLKQVPSAVIEDLHTFDRVEIETYRWLHASLRDYLSAKLVEKPLSIGVFGPPGAGKGFGVKQVAKLLKKLPRCGETVQLVFNLSLYHSPEELSGAFHRIRDEGLRGKVPLVFFDEFDSSLHGESLGWLRYFLAPMQDGEFLDRGVQHPIGRAIFIFAGGTASSYREFAAHPYLDDAAFKAIKGPDFLSRLKGRLDIPGIDFLVARAKPRGAAQPRGTYDPYGPLREFPSESAILLRRAGILAHRCMNYFSKNVPELLRNDGLIDLAPNVLNMLLHVPEFKFGNRSFETILEMCNLAESKRFNAAALPPDIQSRLHAQPEHLDQWLRPGFLSDPTQLQSIARHVHLAYLEERKAANEFKPGKPSHQDWDRLSDFYKSSNYEAALSYADKLRSRGFWFRKTAVPSGKYPVTFAELHALIEDLAKSEHDRWVGNQRRHLYIHGEVESDEHRTHPDIRHWHELDEKKKNQDRDAVKKIPEILAKVGYEIFALESMG